jgi:hypothetical protein
MIRQGKVWLAAALLAMGTSACGFDDPTSSLREGATHVTLQYSTALLTPDSVLPVRAWLQDDQGNFLPTTGATWESADPAVATVVLDTTNTVPGGTFSVGRITGVAGGGTYVRFTSGGFTDSVFVAVIPASFAGSIAPASSTIPNGITITTTGLFSVNAATAAVTVSGFPAIVSAATSSSITFHAGVVAAGPVTISGLVFLGAINLPPLPATTAITVTDPTEPNDAGATATAVAGLAAAGDSVVLWGSIDEASDFSDWYSFTMPITGTVAMRLSWFGSGSGANTANPDFDVIVCNSTTCGYGQDLAANAAAGVAQPESGTSSSIASGTVVYVRILSYVTSIPAPYRLRLRIQ